MLLAKKFSLNILYQKSEQKILHEGDVIKCEFGCFIAGEAWLTDEAVGVAVVQVGREGPHAALHSKEGALPSRGWGGFVMDQWEGMYCKHCVKVFVCMECFIEYYFYAFSGSHCYLGWNWQRSGACGSIAEEVWWLHEGLASQWVQSNLHQRAGKSAGGRGASRHRVNQCQADGMCVEVYWREKEWWRGVGVGREIESWGWGVGRRRKDDLVILILHLNLKLVWYEKTSKAKKAHLQ